MGKLLRHVFFPCVEIDQMFVTTSMNKEESHMDNCHELFFNVTHRLEQITDDSGRRNLLFC
jgi:hypothetical protein